MAGSPLLRATVEASTARATRWSPLAASHPQNEIFFELDEDQAQEADRVSAADDRIVPAVHGLGTLALHGL